MIKTTKTKKKALKAKRHLAKLSPSLEVWWALFELSSLNFLKEEV